jgi:hypothetical protein
LLTSMRDYLLNAILIKAGHSTNGTFKHLGTCETIAAALPLKMLMSTLTCELPDIGGTLTVPASPCGATAVSGRCERQSSSTIGHLWTRAAVPPDALFDGAA